ncbi:MAG: CCA tRNA nucleotidyltransferase [Synechococcaceae cyanobacterium]|nr:CCA tRNA nucleotidyltransferase [Synechococcaceae cyanobacterium]
MTSPEGVAPVGPPASPLGIPDVPEAVIALLQRCAAPDRLALVGGAVRDLLLHRVHDDPWRGLPDLDLLVEPAVPPSATATDLNAKADASPALPPAHRLARRLQAELGAAAVPFCQEHSAYGTVELELRPASGALLLDLASARREGYPQPGENPLVSGGSLLDDLARRDFTINAMALRFDPGGPSLVDPHGGQADLQARQLRFLHAGSVRDDPTRVLRGARYAARLGFELAPASLSQLRDTLARWPWSWRAGDPAGQAPPALGTRLRMELELLLEREPWPLALAALQRWGALALIDPQLQSDRTWRRRLQWATRLGLPLLPALLAGAADPLAVAERLQIPHGQHRLLAQLQTLRARLADRSGGGLDAAGWCALLEAPGVTAESVALGLAAGLAPRRPLLRWWLRWRRLRAPLSPEALMAAEGLRPGPALGERLRQLRAERLAGERC